MSLHINAKPGEIADIVLMPGDPLRAKYIATKWLTNPVQVASTRNMLYFTGTFQDRRITIGASGMGCPSIGIYSNELFTEYGVSSIIRIGTAGSYDPELGLRALINVDLACSESTYARYAFGMEEDSMPNQGNLFTTIRDSAASMQLPIWNGNIHSSDVFYRTTKGTPEVAQKYSCKAVEMEAFALFANARHLGKSAATILTISDVIPTGEHISPEDRERSLDPMINLALHTALAS
ncbi:MAG: purine-nucleoside phosphorylase [Ferruginibacter sp.]